MKIALSSFSLPEPSANALPTARYSFKSALTSAERRIGQQAATPDPSTPDPSTLFASTVAPGNAPVPQSNARLPTDATAAPPGSSLTDLEAHEPTQGGEKRVATSPVGAARGVDPGMHRIERPDQA